MTPDEIEKDRDPTNPFAPRGTIGTTVADTIARLTAERDAALAGAVRVKPLVFQFEPYGKEPSDKARSDGTYVVRTEHEFYRVIPVEGGRFMAPSVSLGTFPTFEDAFETVQKHHDARIRAAIEPAEPSISAAETVLAALDPEALRPILSRLANDTPATCYYSKDFGESMRALPEKAATEAGKMLPLEQGLMFVPATAADRLAPGDKLDAEFTSLTHGAKDIGSYRVQIERLATKENSDE